MEVMNFYKLDKKVLKKAIKEGKIIVYPTDTIYGIGCDALNKEAVDKIRKLKKRDDKPFSVIAPSKKWIFEHCYIKNKNYLKEGPFTFILKIKKRCVSRNVNMGKRTIGVRLPFHPITKVIQSCGMPFVTTSVNISGKKPVYEVKNIPRSMRRGIDLVIDQGKIEGVSSTIIDLTGKGAKIVLRR